MRHHTASQCALSRAWRQPVLLWMTATQTQQLTNAAQLAWSGRLLVQGQLQPSLGRCSHVTPCQAGALTRDLLGALCQLQGLI